MSKKKFLSTALLSVSLLGAGVVNAEVVTKQEQPKPDVVYVVTPSAVEKTSTYTANPVITFHEKDTDGDGVNDTFYYKVSGKLQKETVETQDGKELSRTTADVANKAVLINVAGQNVTLNTDATGQFEFVLPDGYAANVNAPVTFSFTEENTVAGKLVPVEVKVTQTPQVVTYKEGQVVLTTPSGVAQGTYVVITKPDGSTAGYTVNVPGQKEVKFNVGELANGTSIKLYATEADYQAEVKDPTHKARHTYSHVVSTKTAMYRVYNKNNGEHLYTTDANEYAVLTSLGWNNEGVAWQAAVGGTPVYRMYNPNNGDHHYTLDKKEVAALERFGWTNEGVKFYSEENLPEAERVVVFRLYNPNAKGAGSHHYTTDAKEVNALKELGWKYEDRAFYASSN